MNKFFGIGFIGKKGIELKFAPNGNAVASYSLSVPRQFSKDGKKEYDFINCVTWGKPAEFIANNAEKIKKIALEGRINTRSYDAKDGTKRYVTEVITNEVEVVEWSTSTPSNFANSENEMTEVEDSGDIPF